MSIVISCYDCRYFSPGENGCPSYEHDKELSGFMAEDEGICRRHTPRHGKTIQRKNGDEFICFAEWPKVMACDWCGEFELRVKLHNSKQRNNSNHTGQNSSSDGIDSQR